MKVELKRVNDAFHFEAVGAANVPVHIDGSPDIGGVDAGARPMEMILMGLGGCSAIDVVLILQKQRQVIEDLIISVEGERVTNETPSVFKTIHVHYSFKGDLSEDKVKRAIDLSMEKYCSVTAILNKTAEVTHSYSIN
ncbi:MAG: disulfide bond formation regulator [Cytophagales bacterium CG18_big_fil_WC_8_21_14_2_50_42_9]|nr:MAG: disulfide bond formation regulator [Cytophagales bacterium CG18_big_fil_WC_8_21_14_2_50_42_9]